MDEIGIVGVKAKANGFAWSRVIPSAAVVVMLVAGAFVVQQAVLFSTSVSTGTIRHTYAQPLYAYQKSPPGLSRQADEKFGADYLCLYFAATNYLLTGTMYDSNSDPWHRSAVTFPPHLIYLVAHSIQHADFPTSVLLNTFLQIGLFLLASLLFLRGGGFTPASLAGLVLVGFSLFCTPVGTTWFERSQTDLYVAVAFVFFLKAIRDHRPIDFVLAGVFASLKWSSLPLLASSTPVYLSFSRKPLSHKLAWTATCLAVALLLPVLMGRNSADYLKLVAESEINNQPDGISLAFYLPKYLAKIAVFALPTTLIVLRRFWQRTAWNVQSLIEAMFWGANGFICASFGTVAFEYRLVSTLFLVPLAVAGRSVLFPEARQRLTVFSRVLCVGIVLVAFGAQSHVAVVDYVFYHGRAIVPLIGSNLLIMAISLWAAASIPPAIPAASTSFRDPAGGPGQAHGQ